MVDVRGLEAAPWGEEERVELAERAAVEVAARLGARVERPRVLHHSNNVVVHLAPLAIVAKVGASGHRRSGAASLERELRIGRFLAARDAPIASPSSALPAGPHRARDTVVTLWEHCEHDRFREVHARSAGRSLAVLHAALAGYDGPLPPFTAQLDDAARVLARHPLPALALPDRTFLVDTHARLSGALARRRLPAGPLHGEAHLGNVLAAPDGPRWIDFEAACLGPVEWDLAGLGPEALEHHPDADRELLELMGDLRSLCVAVWCWMHPDRAPELREAAEHHLHRLRGHD